jgi:hypothetical protein
MSIPNNEYFYSKQLKSYVLQFMAIFTGLQVQTGVNNDTVNGMLTVPIHYGHKDRVVAFIKALNTQNSPLKLPTMSAYVSQITLAENRMKGIGTERRHAYVPIGGIVPDDISVVYQRMPNPFNLQIDLHIYVSNTDQHFQILEQILPLFDPQLNIQTDDAPFNWTRLTHVKLTNISMETNHPMGDSSRIIQSTITFEMPIWLDTPASIRKNIIENIYMRIGMIDTATDDSFDVLSEFDQQGLEYNNIASADALTFE